MFIIFGFGRRTIRVLGFTGVRLCPNCRNSSQWKVLLIRTWFTLFFVPVIPYESRHVAMCPVCSRGVQVDAQAAKALVAGGAVPAPSRGQASGAQPAQAPADPSMQLPPWARARGAADRGAQARS
ncbi:MAG TPA: zinc-ribbon domain-containing protein [Thermoleophilia bacterium]|nr:zinc-ribbon domain-containing protein [Thermoleophilia bacterium]